MLPADRLEVTISADADDDDTRRVQFEAVGPRGARVATRSPRRSKPVPEAAVAMLVLGIETATSRGRRVAVGDAGAVRGEVQPRGRATARGAARARGAVPVP